MPQPTKPQLAIYAALAIAVLLIGARFLRTGGEGAEGGFASDAPAAVSTEVGAPDGASADPAAASDPPTTGGGATGPVVDVKGAVRRPGVYRLAEGARALDAVERAGGLSGRADRRGVNLAARVVDGGEVIVPRRGERASGAGAAAGAGVVASARSASAGAPGTSAGGAATGAPLALDLDTATAQELEQLDGVGPATAAKIVAYREQHGGIGSVDELDEVSGIGEAKMAAIRAQLGR